MQMPELQEEIAEAAEHALVDDGFETRPGFCWRWARQALESLPKTTVPIPPRGVDAQGAYDWYKAKGMVRDGIANSLPGDLVFFVGPGHGKHGHVGIRARGNLLAENSSVHVGPGDSDARGKRKLSHIPQVTGTVRLRKE